MTDFPLTKFLRYSSTANTMGDSIVRSLQNGVILEDFVVSVSVSDLEGKVYFSLCV